jgi:hypothetical protein
MAWNASGSAFTNVAPLAARAASASIVRTRSTFSAMRRGTDFEDLAQTEDAVELFGVVTEYEASQLGLNLNQSLGFAATQSIAHGRATNAELFGERRLRQLLTEFEAVLDD